MRIAMLTGLFPAENIDEILKCSKGHVQSAADALQKSIVQGLGALMNQIDIINLPFVGSYPKHYRRLYTPSNRFAIQSNYGAHHTISGHNIRYCNLTYFKIGFMERAAKKALRVWAKGIAEEEEKVIIVYALQKPMLEAAFAIKKSHRNVKVIAIVADLPQFMSAGGTSWLRRRLQQSNVRYMTSVYQYIDGYILLTEAMADAMDITSKPREIIEGIYDTFEEQWTETPGIRVPKTIVYAGTLARRYGVMRLVEAFVALQDPDLRLIICGEGDSKADILAAAVRDPRITATGNIPRPEVLRYLREATLLVNPRTPEGEFTKYSFPSKTMEYLASGTPTILYKLPGIPEEYYRYCYALEDLSIPALSAEISRVISLPAGDREANGQAARQFILSLKSPEIQTKRIIKLINTLHNVSI